MFKVVWSSASWLNGYMKITGSWTFSQTKLCHTEWSELTGKAWFNRKSKSCWLWKNNLNSLITRLCIYMICIKSSIMYVFHTDEYHQVIYQYPVKTLSWFQSRSQNHTKAAITPDLTWCYTTDLLLSVHSCVHFTAIHIKLPLWKWYVVTLLYGHHL